MYLVSQGSSYYALKIGYDSLEHLSEVNALKQLSQSAAFENYLIDVDDARLEGKDYPFSVIRYIKGDNIHRFLQENGLDWVYLVGWNLLGKLTELHGTGWIFGDLKPENVLVSGRGAVHLIDFGGVTGRGRAVKQFTEMYDRGYWSAGSRSAEESYDLFSFAVLMLSMLDSSDTFRSLPVVLPHNRTVGVLLDRVYKEPACRTIAPFLEKNALTGKYASSKEARLEWRKQMLQHRMRRPPAPGKKGVWVPASFALSIALFAATVYFFQIRG